MKPAPEGDGVFSGACCYVLNLAKINMFFLSNVGISGANLSIIHAKIVVEQANGHPCQKSNRAADLLAIRAN